MSHSMSSSVDCDLIAERDGWGTCLLGCAVLPLTMVLLAFTVKAALGPYWLGSNSDPEYCYLFNGLNILGGYPPFHIDHPGTPVQETAAAVIVIRHWLAGEGTVVSDALARPEMYLMAINTTLVVLYGIALWGLGLCVVRTTGQWTAALLAQLPPFLATQSIRALGRVDPEPMLLIVTALLATALVWHIRNSLPRPETAIAVIVGALVGVAVATKINALPFLLLPLLVFPRPWLRVLSLVSTCVAFLIAVLPSWPRFPQFGAWVVSLASHQGEYGHGAAGFMAWSQAFARLAALAKAEPLYAGMVVISLVVGGCAAWRRWGARREGHDRLERVLLALAVVQSLQFLMVVKHPAPHYLIPGLGMVGLNAALVWLTFRRQVITLPGGTWYGWGVVLALLLCSAPRVCLSIDDLIAKRDDQLSLTRVGDTLSRQGRFVFFYRASDPRFALAFGNEWAGQRYSDVLQKMYPDAIFYHIWGQFYYTFTGRIPAEDMAALARQTHLFLQGTAGRTLMAPDHAVLAPIAAGFSEAIYRVHPVPEPPEVAVTRDDT